MVRNFVFVASFWSAFGGVQDHSQDLFVVRLHENLAKETQKHVEFDAPQTETSQLVNISILGYPFQCQLPLSGSKTRDRIERVTRHIASLRAAALFGHCFNGSRDGSSVELCVGDMVSFGNVFAAHKSSFDRPLQGGGFQQYYVNDGVGVDSLSVQVRCGCLLPPLSAVHEPACRPGEMIQAFRAGRRDREYAVVGAETIDVDGVAWFSVSWAQQPWPRIPWDNSSASLTTEEVRVIAKSSARTIDGRRCDDVLPDWIPSTTVTTLASATTVSSTSPIPFESSIDSETSAFPKQADFGIKLSAVSCCGLRELRDIKDEEMRDLLLDPLQNSSAEYWRLLAPLVGRCLRVTSVIAGWWVYELCWPWRVRQLHQSINGEVESSAIVLGEFGDIRKALSSDPSIEGSLSLLKSLEGHRYELVTSMKGQSCESITQKWRISLPTSSAEPNISGVGGSFNPSGGKEIRGILVRSDTNIEGCRMFNESFDGDIVVLRRGKCWFHTKALNAMASGAAAIIVYNNLDQMIDVMEGVDELPSPMIPTMLVDKAAGLQLLSLLGSPAIVSKASSDHLESNQNISTTVTFGCSADWYERQAVCESGDEVDVRLPPPPGQIPGSRWPKSSVRHLRAVVDEVYRNDTMKVSWTAAPEGEELGDLPDIIESRFAFFDSAPCDSIGGSRIERVAEPQACHVDVMVHVAELCAHPRLAAPQPPATQVIACSADGSTRERLARRDGVVLEQTADAGQLADSN